MISLKVLELDWLRLDQVLFKVVFSSISEGIKAALPILKSLVDGETVLYSSAYGSD